MTSTFVLVFSAAIVALLAVLMMVMPAVAPATAPLGVSVPRAHARDDAVRGAVRRYRIGLAAAGVLTIGLAAVLAFTAPAVGAVVPVFVFLVLGTIVFVVARRGIAAAKRAGDWYAGVSVQRSAEVTAPTHHRPPIVWPIVALVLLAVAVGIGAAVYPTLPTRFPVHYDLAGTPDRFEPKSLFSVFGTLLITTGMAILLFVLAIVVGRSPLRSAPGDDPEGAIARSAARRAILSSLLAEMTAAIAGGIALLNVLLWLVVSPLPAVLVGTGVTIALSLVVVVAAVVRVARIRRPAVATAHAPDAPDDDRHWKGGLIYINRDDPALWVPKRFGVGWTINFGHPAGVAIGVGSLLLIAGGIVTAVIAGGGSH